MSVKMARDSRIGNWYRGWYARNWEDEPEAVTECHVRKILIYQFFYWCRTHETFGTQIHPWVFIMIGFFIGASIAAPQLMAWFFVIPVIVIAAVVIIVPAFSFLLLIAKVSRLDKLLEWSADQLAEPMLGFLDQVAERHEKMWALNVCGFPIGWIFPSIFFLVLEVSVAVWYQVTGSLIPFLILGTMVAVQSVLIALCALAIFIAVEEKYEPMQKIGDTWSKRSKEKAERATDKPSGLYRLLISVGLCRYVEWY